MELTPKYVCVRARLRKALHWTVSVLSTVHTATIMNAGSNEAVVLLSLIYYPPANYSPSVSLMLS